jgi:two-component system chemotaxis sensor kinase CheA
MTNDDILNIFFLECEEALAAAETGLIDCREGSATGETVNSIFRSVHSIKGGAGAFGFTALQAFTHKFETVLSFVREGQLGLGAGLNDLMLRAFDVLTDHVSAARGEADTPDDAAVSADLEAMSARAEAGLPAEGAADEAPVEEFAPVAAADDFMLDFDLDSLIGAIDADAPLTVGPAVVGVAAPSPDESADWAVLVRPRAGAMANGGDPLLLLRELEALGGVCTAVHHSHIPELADFDATNAYLGFAFQVPGSVDEDAIRDIFDFVGEDCGLEVIRGDAGDRFALMMAGEPEVLLRKKAPVIVAAPIVAATPVASPSISPGISTVPKVAAVAAPAALVAEPAPTRVVAPTPEAVAATAATAAADAARKATVASGQTIRVDLAKLDRLIDTVGELVIAQAMMAQRLSENGLGQIDELGMLDQLTRELQDSAMSIRAQPIGSVFSRVPRIVRELETETGKRVRLEVSGEQTELDKTVVERLGEPLTHLIRNAIDHGLESTEARIAAGKAPEGVVKLSAEHRSGKILISIADDGAGINRERVFSKAVEKGLIAADAQLSDEEIDNLIFAPGFSTAAVVSNISGRGVGMDVVRQNVKDLGGRITIQSTPGKGSVFTLALPLTLAISDGMIVQVGDQTLVVPLTHVVESLRPNTEDLRSMGNGRTMLDVRGTFLPIIPLAAPIGALGAADRPEEAVLIVVETEDAGSAILMVDSILDQRQFVIKSLETNYRPVPCVAGATILGDGKVALILDVDTLVGSAVSYGTGLRLAA